MCHSFFVLHLYCKSIIIIFSCIIFFSECPVENKNKVITEEKKKIHKVISVILCFLYGITGAILIMFSYKIGVILLYTLILISFLVIIATFQELERRWRYEKGKE